MGENYNGLAKQYKFNLLMHHVLFMVECPSYFKYQNSALIHELSSQEQETLQELKNIYAYGLPKEFPWNPDSFEYDKYIDTAKTFITAVVNRYIPKDEQIERDAKLSYLEEIALLLRDKEDEGWKIGSKFLCVINEDVQLKKITVETKEHARFEDQFSNTYQLCLYEFDPEVRKMTSGLYKVEGTGDQFYIYKPYPFNTKECYIPLESSVHAILPFYNPDKE
ncbi:hypothetical protein CN918_31435 [Priestia megaterium]|nr:hypothetical protein CN918_31435 [Priestia megaterium]